MTELPKRAEPAATSDEPAAAMIVVGLGASAGGIPALQQFFTRVPASLNAAYVVILHLSPDHDSQLAQVLQTTTSMPVDQVVEPVLLEPRHVYVISPSHSLKIVDGKLVATEVTRPEERRTPVDVFFRTLADVHRSRAVCVVLSGTGANGSTGLRHVKKQGGLTIVQRPEEAEYADMPRHSIATGLVDYVLPIDEMPAKIAAFQRLLRDEDESQPVRFADEAEPLREVLALLRARTGHDFSNYKTGTLGRRIERRMAVCELATIGEYAQFMRQHPDEAVALMNELLISVTDFFRDPTAFAVLEQLVVPRIMDGKGAHDHVRAWVAGCATGEEAYSVAMLLAEASGSHRPGIQVFATDLDERAIVTAREGFYTESDVAGLSPERLNRFFVKDADGYRVRRELREMILFAHHNLIKDPPFSHLDLVCCRNLMIYLNRAIQDRLVETFHFALRPGGYLFLGTSELPDGTNDLFATIDKNAHVFENRSLTSRLPVPEYGVITPIPPAQRHPAARQAGRIAPPDLHLRLLEQFAPPSIVVTEEYHVVHVSDRAGEFLQVSGGEPSRDLLRLIRAELRGDLRTALHQAARQRTNVEVRNVRLEGERRDRRVNILVRPVLREGDPARGFFLVLFEHAEPPRGTAAEPVVVSVHDEPLALQLEDELARLKTQLRATIEQYETQVEEAKASNEELQAVNEELRSAAEELETSKEELQSVNEELSTVNQELKIKIEELGLTNNDFQNLIVSTDIGTIFLDRALRVKLSTPRAQEIFNLLPSDIGRPLSDITSTLIDDRLHEQTRQVLERLQSVEREVQTRDGRWFQMRILPYWTLDARIDGVVMTFQDITERRRAEGRVRATEERLRLLIDRAADYAIFTLTLDGIIDSWNAGAERMFGYSASEIVGRDGAMLFTPEDRAAAVPQAEIQQSTLLERIEEERWYMRKDGTRLFCSGVMIRLGEDRPVGLAKIARDLTAQRLAESALQDAHADLEVRVRERTGELEAAVFHHVKAERQVTGLVRRLVKAQEDERARIARDLHDQFGQQLTALRLTLERHRDRSGVENTDDDLARAIEQARAIDAEIDFLAWELRPAALDELGLAVALPRYVGEWSLHCGIAAESHTAGFVRGHLSPEAEIAFYRVAQEALNNVLKHGHATRVDVILESRDRGVVLVVEDDGVGFEVSDPAVAEKGIGLAGMRERAALIGALLEVESSPGKGTSIFLRSPILSRTNEPA